MEENLGAQQRTYACRGNLFSFALDWGDIVKHMDQRTTEEQLKCWPHAPDAVAHWVRIVLKKGDVDMMKHIKELKVRAHVVLGLARIYIERHIDNLDTTLQGSQIKQRKAQLMESAKNRVEEHYPEERFDAEGALIQELTDMVETAAVRWKKRSRASLVEDKNQTMPDAVSEVSTTFEHTRPTGVVAERDANLLVEHADQMKAALAKYSSLDVQVATRFEDQFVPLYLSRIYPWALNFECGGPEYSDFFVQEEDEEALRTDGRRVMGTRRHGNSAVFTPQRHAKNLARRIEVQIAGDWGLVPGAHNLTMRYAALKEAHLSCRMRVTGDKPLDVNAQQLIDAADMLFKRLHQGSYTSHGRKRPLNGDITKLQWADNITSEERMLVGSFGRVLRKVAGSQVLRPRIGHALFGNRVNNGEGTFHTVSPNRRHSALIHRLHRARKTDSSLHAESTVSEWRMKLADADVPNLILPQGVSAEEAWKALDLPPLNERHASLHFV
jgi:hypothetical protein